MKQSESENRINLSETFMGADAAKPTSTPAKSAAPAVKKDDKATAATTTTEEKFLGIVPEKYKTVAIVLLVSGVAVGGWFAYKHFFKHKG